MDLDSRYELLEKIGSGSFATVYRARDRELTREVAIKQVHEEYLNDPRQLDRYWQEAQLLATLQHPNIITIYDIVRERGWLIMELMQTNLAQRMEGRQMDLRALRTTIAHCLRALKYLHSRGIIHGDIKPSNMMIDSRRRIKIGDFGLARRASNEEGSLLKGTTKYMAPEVVSDEFGEVGPSSDMYSLGFSAYELMCGPNFESLFPGLNAFGRNMQVAWMMWHAAPDRRLPAINRVLEGVPEDLAHVIERLIEKDQKKRFRSADEALSALNVDLKIINKGGGLDETGELEVAESGDGKKKQRMIAVGAFAVSMVLCLLLFLMPGGGGQNEPTDAPKVMGIVREIFLDDNSLKVENIEDGRAEERKLGAKPLIRLKNSGENLLLRELKAGDRVEIERAVGDDGKPYMKVMVSRPVVSKGVVKSVDLQNQRLVVKITEGELRDDLPLRFPDRAEIFLNGQKVVGGKTVQLRDVKVDDAVDVSHLDEPGAAGGRVVDFLKITRIEHSSGFVEKYNPVDNELYVSFGRGSTAGSIKLPVAENCRITVPGVGGNATAVLRPNELQPGDRVTFSYDNAFRTISVTREKQKVEGVVRRVSTVGNGSIVVGTSDNRELTITAEPGESDVRLSQQSVEIGDLRMYDQVTVLYDEGQGGELVARTIDAARPVKNDRWAIVIGNEGFNDKFLTPLRHSIANANRVKDVLLDRYAFPKDRLRLLIDRDRSEVEQQIKSLLDETRSQTQVIVYVSTHGYVGDDGRVYLACKDFNWDKISETGLPLDWLVQQLEASGSQDKILLLDASHSGTGKDLEKQPSTAEMLKRLQTPLTSTWAIASCSDGQRGQDLSGERTSLFAHAIGQAFGGDADVDRDLHLTPAELHDFLRREMESSSGTSGRPQTPALIRPR